MKTRPEIQQLTREQLEGELEAARRTIDVLVARVQQEEQELQPSDPASPDFRQTIRELETAVAARSRDLAAREAYYRALYNQSPDAILTLEGDVVVGCNRTAELTFGRQADELVGRSVTQLLNDQSGAALTGLLWSGFMGVGDAELELPSGRLLGFSVARLPDDRVLLVLRDVTQRRRLEEQLERARLQAGFGQLAAELASEITSSLSVVAGRLHLLRQRPPQDPESLRVSLDVMADHCRSIDAVVENLRALGRPRPPRPQLLDARELVSAAVSAEGARLRRVRLQVELDAEVAVRADRSHSILVLRNLLSWLADHMPKGRLLRVTAGLDGGGPVLELHAEGLAVPDEVREVLAAGSHGGPSLDPSQGLGLAIARVLVGEAGGTLTLGEGGQVLRYQLGPGPKRPETTDADSILVVDDDQLLCDTVTWMLSGMGFRVRTANSAEQALRILASAQFDCILADLILPGRDGIELLLTTRRRWPERTPRLVLTTGAEVQVPEGLALLPKPFDRQQLLEAVSAAAVSAEG